MLFFSSQTETKNRKLVVLAVVVLCVLIATGCRPGEGSNSDSQTRSNPGRPLRTVEQPTEIFPLTFDNEDEMLEFAVDAYNVYRSLVSEQGRKLPEYNLGVIADIDQMRNLLRTSVCLALGGNASSETLERRVLEFIRNELANDPDQQQQLRLLLWIALSLQYDRAELPDPNDYENPENVPDHEPDFRTICGN